MVNCIVVDDDQNIVDVFCELLNLIGIDVLGTGNDGLDALNLYKKHHPDVVFTDLNMPEYDGFFAIEEIKDIDLNAKIIAVTGDSDASKSYLLDSLNITVICKPFDMHSIKQAISDIVLSGDELTEIEPFKIRYKFKDDKKYYSCIVTYEQYRNFKKLPVVQDCEVINNRQKQVESQYTKMQEALNLAFRNDTSHIKMLSEVS